MAHKNWYFQKVTIFYFTSILGHVRAKDTKALLFFFSLMIIGVLRRG